MSAKEEVGIEIKSNLKETKDQLKQVDAQLAKLNNQKHSLQIRAEKLAETKKSISAIDLAMKKLQEQKANLKIGHDAADVAKNKMKEINHAMDLLRARKATLKVEAQELKDADKEFKNLDKEMRSLSKQQATLHVKAEGLEGMYSDIGKVKEVIKKMPAVANEGFDFSSSLNTLGGQFDKVGSKMLGFLNPFASKLNQLIGLGAVFKVIDAGVNMVKNSMDGAIDRFDQLNNFPKVMSNLQIGEKESKAALDELSNGLNGLPTTLNEASVSVQQFTSKNKDVGKSTKMFLALNNAILAGGASTEIQSSALEQLSQGYSKGKIDMMEWRSALTAMPAQIDQVAQAFGMSSDSLGEALRNGDISMDQFMDKIIELNEKGANGFKTFEEQAKNATGGIRTSIKTMGSAVTRGLTKIMGAADTALKKADVGGFSGVFNGIGSMFESGLGKVGEYIEKNQNKINDFIAKLKGLGEAASDYLKNFNWKDFGDGLKDTVSGGKEFILGFKPVLDFLQEMVMKLGDGSFEKGLGRIPKKLIQWGIGFKVAGKALQLFSGPLGKFLNLKLFGEGKITTFDAFKGNMFDGITSFAKNAGNLTLVFGAIKVVEAAAEALKQVDEKVPANFSSVISKIGSISLAVGAIGLLAYGASKVPPKEMFVGLATVAAISLDLMIAAEALRQIDEKVPNSFNALKPKLIGIGAALVGMGTLVTAAGLLATANPIAAIGGLVAVTAISLELMLAAEALKQVNEKVPDDIGNIAKKMGSIAVAIGGLGVLATAVGAFVSTGVGAVLLGAGLYSIAKVSSNLVTVANAINDVKTKVPENIGSVKGKVESIASIIRYMTNTNLGSLIDAFKNKFKEFNVTAVSNVVMKMSELGEILHTMPAIQGEAALNSIKEIQKVIKSLSDGETIWKKVTDWAKSLFESNDIGSIKKYITSLTEITENLESINKVKIDTGKAKTKIKEIIATIGLLGEPEFTKRFDSIGSVEKFNSVRDIVNTLSEILQNINSLTGHVETEAIIATIESLRQIFTNLSDISGSAKNVGKMKDSLADSAEGLQKLSEIAYSINNIYVGVDPQQVIDAIEAIRRIFVNLDSISGSVKNVGAMKETLSQASEGLNSLQAITTTISYLQFDVDSDLVIRLIESVRQVLVNLDSISGSIKNVGKIKADLVATSESLTTLVGIASTISQIQFEINTQISLDLIESVRQIFVNLDSISGSIKKVAGMQKDLEKAQSAVSKLTEVATVLSAIPNTPINYDAVYAEIESVRRLLIQINDLPSPKGIEEMQALITEFEKLVGTLNGLAGQFEPVGEGYGKKIISGFKSAKIVTAFKDKISEVIKALSRQSFKDSFKSIGKSYGDALNSGFGQGIANMANKIDSQITNLNSKARQFIGLGNSFGMLLANGFDAQIQNLSTSTSKQIEAIQLSLNKLRLPNLTPNRGGSGSFGGVPSITASTGGYIEKDKVSYLSNGGQPIFKAKGTDTVSAMLTPGEYVHNTDAVKTFGLDFMQRVNSLDLKGTYQAFTSRFANKLATQPIMNTVNNNVYNNQTTNNNPRVNQYMTGSNASHGLRHVKRYLNRL